MISVRKYEKKDKEALREICIETSAFNVEAKNMKKFLCLMFNDYYTEVEGDNCFVAVDENDNAVGYLICAKNFDEYYKIFKHFYQPEIDSLGLKYALMSRSEILIHKLFSKKYPAHLHIDLTAACRRQGVGSKLISALKDDLKSKGVNSLMLSCGASNEAAVKFYKKNGFEIVKNFMGSYIMAIEF
ncbi:MAG: GNAT family N-acetyltransferase [Clostridia bacterium]|nr:GNAT family N-acetyltransferase [Clostridia bacterium]